MFIGELASVTGVPVRTIRYYEDIGLLPEPARNGADYPTYDEAPVRRLRFVVAAKTIGLKLDQIHSILEVADSGRSPCNCTRQQIAERADEVRAAITVTTRLLGQLDAVAGRKNPERDSNGNGTICALIEQPST